MSVNQVPDCVEAKCNYAAQSSSMGSEKWLEVLKVINLPKNKGEKEKGRAYVSWTFFIRSPW